MENWKLLALISIMSVFTCSAHGMSFSLDKEHWISKNWEDQPLVERIASEVASLMKRSKMQQFYGLMGKRAEISQSMNLGQKRKQGEMFVGLMGRRSLIGDTFTRIIPAERSAAKESDLEEEWDQLQHY